MPGTTPTANDILQVRVNCRCRSQLGQNVLHYRVQTNGPAPGMTLIQIADALSTSFAAVWKQATHAVASYNSLSVQNVTGVPTVPAESVQGAGVGTALGPGVPTQVCGLISLHTGFGGRHYRGRVYIPFLGASALALDGTLDPAYVALLQQIAVTIGPVKSVTFGGITCTMSLIVRHRNDFVQPPLPNGTDVTICTPSAKAATQRRRGDYGQPNF